MASDDEKDEGMAEAALDDDKTSASSSNSDSDSDLDTNGKGSALQLEQLQGAVAANPNSYDAHVQYINALRKATDLGKLRLAREVMNAVFPLSASMWLEWCDDESRLATSADAISAVEALYERGVHEYLSIPLWLQYLEFVEERDTEVAECTVPGIAKMRALFECALSSTGLHYTEGGKVWEAYREYELALLLTFAEASNEAKAKQVDIVRNVFQRQLTVPLADHAQTLEEYKDWELQQGVQIGNGTDELAGLPMHVTSTYKKAEQMCKARENYESNIAMGKPVDGELLQHYLTYISVEEATGEPARAQILYERAVSVFPVTHEIWLKYTQYLDVNLKVASVIRSVYARAVRNCPWVCTLWTMYLLALERTSAPAAELAAVFERAVLSGFQTPIEYEDVFLTRAHYLRRQIMAADETSDQTSDCALLHDTFDRASKFMSTYFPDFVDRSLRLSSYWAHLEAKLLKDITAARGVWETLIKSHGWMLEVWQCYISMELLLGNVKEVRAIYKRCYSRRLEGIGTEVMCGAWLRFEEEYGSLEDFDRAALKVGPRVAEVQKMQVQQEQKVAANRPPTTNPSEQEAGQVTASKTMKRGSSKKPVNVTTVPAESGRKRGLGYTAPEHAAKRQKGREVVAEAGGGPVDTAVDRDQSMDVTGSEEQEQVLEKAMSAGRPQESERSGGPSNPVIFKDECTAFLKNLGFDVTEEDIREFFITCGGVKEVRLLRERGTALPRGLAYVDFVDEESLAAAVAKDMEKLKGRQVSVARSNPTGGRSGGRGFGPGRGGRSGAPGRGRGGGQRGGREWSGGRGDQSDSQGGGRVPDKHSKVSHRRGGHVNLTGKNTFAVPRTVAARPLGWGNPKDTPSNPSGSEAAKSNSEFRNMFLNKS